VADQRFEKKTVNKWGGWGGIQRFEKSSTSKYMNLRMRTNSRTLEFWSSRVGYPLQ
jgi:hypothetical protein